jgi:mRNA interferase MazF
MPYVPKQGDIVKMNFSPQSGHEQANVRPALIVSTDSFYRYTHMAIVCPITNTDNGFPLHVPLDSRTETTGVIECEQCKSLDIISRNAIYREALPSDILATVLRNVKLFF